MLAFKRFGKKGAKKRDRKLDLLKLTEEKVVVRVFIVEFHGRLVEVAGNKSYDFTQNQL